ncbi:uncharacterized protein LOC144295824 isoform X2 [Canis aureus]
MTSTDVMEKLETGDLNTAGEPGRLHMCVPQMPPPRIPCLASSKNPQAGGEGHASMRRNPVSCTCCSWTEPAEPQAECHSLKMSGQRQATQTSAGTTCPPTLETTLCCSHPRGRSQGPCNKEEDVVGRETVRVCGGGGHMYLW